MKLNIHKDYKILSDMNMPKPKADGTNVGDDEAFQDIRKILTAFDKPEGLNIYDTYVKGKNGEPDIKVRVYKKEGIKNAPVIMNVHGGGFVAGDLDNDNTRMAYLAMNIPCVVVSVEYRLAPKTIFPGQLNDCLTVWDWIYDSAKELDIDNTKMGLFGTSAGGNICAGLAFYIRDHAGHKISLNVMNVPALGVGESYSLEQMRFDAPVLSGDKLSSAFVTYLGGYNGTTPSYYAVPNLAFDFSELPPTLLIVAEYDPLRDYAMRYATKLLENAVPCELYLMPRVGHGFDMVNAPMTKWIRDGVCASFRREFDI